MTVGTRYDEWQDGTRKWDRVNNPDKTRLVEYEFISETDEIGRHRATQQSTVLCSVMRRGWDTTNTQRDGTQRIHNLGLRKNTLWLIPLNGKTEIVNAIRISLLIVQKMGKFNDLYFMKVKNVNISKSALGNFLHSFAMDYTWVGPPETVIKVAVLLV